jgi:cyclic dehypoxanthinyl futalosine synthase
LLNQSGEQMTNKQELLNKIYNSERINDKEALSLFSWDILELGKAADMRRQAISPTQSTVQEVGFIVDRIINFTNICDACCSFCAFHARANLIKPYEMPIETILQKIKALVNAGGTQVMLQGGLHPDNRLQDYLNMITAVKTNFPDIWLHSFSPSEVVHVAKKESTSIDKIIKEFKKAGVDSMPGASDLLVDRIRKKISPKKASVKEWCKVIFSLAKNDMKSSATMTYGMGETDEEKIKHLAIIRDVQDKTGNIQAFIPWSFSPASTRMDTILPATGVEYLKILAISRIFLDNIIYFQAGWLTEGLKLAQIALSMGANDMGGILTEEVVVKATGIKTTTNQAQLIKLIKDTGKTPVKRDSLYSVLEKF